MLIKEVREYTLPHLASADPGHDADHVHRITANIRKLVAIEASLNNPHDYDMEVLEIAAWLHDVSNAPKDSPERSLSSGKSAHVARALFSGGGLFAGRLNDARLDILEDAIISHSFSAGITPKTKEGDLFQDADRLDGIGAIGVARCFNCHGVFAGKVEAGKEQPHKLYHPTDPFHADAGRDLNDKVYALDHFYKKLLTVDATMRTEAGRRIAKTRKEIMLKFIEDLKMEIH